MQAWLINAFEQVQNSITGNKLHHAHIVSGKQGVGKSELVNHIAATLLCQAGERPTKACGQCKSCQLMASGSHPDWYQVKSENQIGVDDIRLVSNKLNSSSGLMKGKVLLIHDAHKMTVAAANSLLKTLEEPTANTYLFLTTSKVSGLLPTIVSRCRRLGVTVESQAQTREWLQTSFSEVNRDLFQLYWQRPLFLAALLQDKDNVLHTLGADIASVHSGEMQSDTFCSRYQDHIDSCLDWLQFALNQESKTTTAQSHDQLWHCHNELNACKKLAAQSGINKSLVICRALASLPQNLTFHS